MTMPSQPPSPQNTLVILLGADNWPHHETFYSSPAFRAAADQWKNYLLGTFRLPQAQLLNGFNSNFNASEHYLEIKSFLRRYLKPDAKEPLVHDVLLFFIGHAELYGRDGQLLLGIQATDGDIPTGTALQMQSLANELEELASQIRLYLILDCSACPDSGR